METILHITDIHFGWEGDNSSKKAERTVCLEAMLREISKLQSPWKPSVICLTGDVGWRGAASDYIQAKEWLDQLIECCGLDYSRLVVCPGNHDIIREQARSIGRPSTSKEADEVLEPPLAEQYLRSFSGYNKFCQELGLPTFRLAKEESYLVGERTLGDLRFVTLNSAWFAKGDDDRGKLLLGLPHLKCLAANNRLPLLQFDGKEPITVALMHHPAEWLHTDEQHAAVAPARPNTLDYLARRCHVLLTGHTHGEVRRADRIAEGAWHLTGGSVYAGDSHFNSFRLLQIRLDQIVYRSFEFDPRSADNNWKSTEAVSLPLELEKRTEGSAPPAKPTLHLTALRTALRADASRTLEQKSRLLRPIGRLPRLVPREVSVRVSSQRQEFDPEGRFLRWERTEQIIPFYEATRRGRRTLLLGDLGAGKSTLGAQLVVETIDRSETAIAAFIPAKSLQLHGQFAQRELLQSIDDYLAKQAIPNVQGVELDSLLEHQIEVLLVLDGLDELAPDVAARLLRQAGTLPEHWPTIQVAATARPIELAGVTYTDWLVVHTVPLDEEAKRQFITEEMVADGTDSAQVDQKAATLLQALKDMPALDALASSPLTIRLVYPRIRESSSNKSLTLGDLLYELLLERLGGWQKRDDKPSTFGHFDSILPTPEAKAELLAVLTYKAIAGSRMTVDEAKASLQDAAASISGANKYLLAEEALTCFAWLGLIAKGAIIEFPLQPLVEVSAAIGLLTQWRSQMGNWVLPDHTRWRVVSFAAAVARRRGWLAELQAPILQFIDSLLTNASGLPAACYIIVETSHAAYAEKTVKAFQTLGHRPMTVLGEEPRVSARNIAKTLRLAGEAGFEWLFSQYLDPRYPLVFAGSGVIRDVLEEWAALSREHLTETQKQQLTKLVKPYLATGEGQFFGVLRLLAVLVPQAFELADRLWYQSHALDSPPFGDWVAEEFSVLGQGGQNQPLLSNVLQYRAAESERAGLLWLQLNPDIELPVSLIRSAFRSLVNRRNPTAAMQFSSSCSARLSEKQWRCFARWMLSTVDVSAAGAAVVLFDAGERRLSILGDVLIRAIHDGGYMVEAEKTLDALVMDNGDQGVRWLASRIFGSYDSFGAHSGCWRILLKHIEHLNDGPEVLARCARNMGPFTLPRYPEVREAFLLLLNGPRALEFRTALRAQLHSLDPKTRRGASLILVATDPGNEAEALFVAIRSRAGRHRDFDGREWEVFCLTLNFTPSVLSSLKSRLEFLEVHSRALALVLLLKGGLEIDPAYRAELESSLLASGNWYLARDPVGQAVLGGKDSIARLIAQLDHPSSEPAEQAANHLFDLHRGQLSLKTEAKCIAIKTKPGRPWELANLMVRIAHDGQFALALKEACEEIRSQGAPAPFLELILRAKSEPSAWKDVVWAMFCDDTRFSSGSSEADANGGVLLEYGLEVKEHSTAIGEAAIECLNDPRMKKNRWTDAYQWLAVIANEFADLNADSIRDALRHGQPITCAAAAALIARLGEVPEGLLFQHGMRQRPPTFAGTGPREMDPDRLLAKLKEYSRDSDELHPALLGAIEHSLFLPPLTEEALSELASIGKPGALTSNALRFCYGLPPKLAETLPLLDIWGRIWNQQASRPHLQQLLRLWMIVRESQIDDHDKAADEYLANLDQKLIQAEIWKLPLASEILRIRGFLSKAQIKPIFLAYAAYPSFLHEMLFEQLTRWLAIQLDEELRNAVIDATLDVLVILNEEPWDSSDHSPPNTWAYLLFPSIQWALKGESSAASEAVFLRGLRFSFERVLPSEHTIATDVTNLIPRLEPLLGKAPREILAATILAGLGSAEPTVRAYCSLIRSFAELSHN